VPGASVVERREGLIRLKLAEDGDVAEVAALAQATGRLLSFSYEPPTLSQLFHQAVGS
jgi:ABC-2 type transport system ATP-binding protein